MSKIGSSATNEVRHILTWTKYGGTDEKYEAKIIYTSRFARDKQQKPTCTLYLRSA